MKHIPARDASGELWQELTSHLPLAPWSTAEQALERYVERLLATNRVPNLVARSQRNEASLWDHLFDSLNALYFVDPKMEMRLMDVGSGNGMPGIPLAIALPDRDLLLLERSTRKSAFLEFAAAHLMLKNVRVIASELSAEVLGEQQPDLALLRAVRPDEQFVSVSVPATVICSWLCFCTAENKERWITSAESRGYRPGQERSYRLPGSNARRVLIKFVTS